MKLFAVYIGGAHEKSLIELHDMRFVAGTKIEDCYERLKESWWGIPESLHLDAWGALTYADGHMILLKEEAPADESKKLYFVNLGGYDPHKFTELHENVYLVAESESQAKVKALKKVQDWQTPHCDNSFEVEQITDISAMLQADNLSIHLEPCSEEIPFQFICKYTPIGKSDD